MWTVLGDLSAMLFITDPSAAAAQLDVVQTHIDELASYESIMTCGDPSVGMSGALTGTPEEVTLVLTDGCAASSEYDNCVAFGDGVFARGLHGGVEHFIDQATAFAYNVANSTNMSPTVCIPTRMTVFVCLIIMFWHV